jgi:H+/Cl- antiporter ClcA
MVSLKTHTDDDLAGAGWGAGPIAVLVPLFFIGATLGNTLAWALGAPVDLFATLGLLAVFAAATNTPLAFTIIGVERHGAATLLFPAQR